MGMYDDIKDKTIRVGDILEYCSQMQGMLAAMREESVKKVGHGLSDGSLYGFLAYGHQQEVMYGFEIPNMLKYLVDEKQ